MQIGRIEGATRVLGKSQGYYGLPVRDEVRARLPNLNETVKAAREWAASPAVRGSSAADIIENLCDLLTVLPVLDKIEDFGPPDGPNTPVMVTAWHPNPGELVALNAGASIHVQLVGRGHPPIMVTVGPLPIE
jgi:hypothetical protein